jgi:hypothetical protein
MGDEYIKMIRQSMKAAGMSKEQIDAAIAMQQAALANPVMQQAMAMQKTMADNAVEMRQSMADAMGKIAGMDMDSYFEFSEKPSINKSYQWAVACGADLINLRADIINDLTTGGDKDELREEFAENWGIESKKDFIKMAESLKKGRHSVVYHQIAEGKKLEGFEEEAESLKEAKKQFKKDKLIGDQVPNMLIWDIGRLVNITRFAFDAKYVDRAAALSYLKDAALLVKKHYKSWKELSIGYQFGRAVWGGLEQYDDLKEGMEQLLTENDSPWVTLPFNMKLNFEEET